MKKHAAILGLAALIALPACSNQDGYNHRYDQGNGEDNQYSAHDQDSREYHNDNNHRRWKDAKIEEMVDHFFKEADTNHDGYISWKEFEAHARKKFQEADTNHDGKLSRDEVVALKYKELKKMHEKMHDDDDNK